MNLIDRLFAGKAVQDLGALWGADGLRVRVLVVERKGAKRVVIKSSGRGHTGYTALNPDSVERLRELLGEAAQVAGGASAR